MYNLRKVSHHNRWGGGYILFDEVVERRGTNSYKWDFKPDVEGDAPDNLIPMWVADMDFKSPAEVLKALEERVKHGIFGYTFRPHEYYESIIDWYAKRHGINIPRDWIVHIPGVVPGIALTLRLFTSKNDGIIIQPPVYWPFFDVIKENSRKVVENPLLSQNGKYIMDLEDLEEKLKYAKAIILCNPHNPVGRVWTREELEDLARIVEKGDLLIISDEIHMDIVYEPHDFVSMLEIERIRDRVVVLSSPSKTFNLAGIQSAFAVVPNPHLREVMEKEVSSLHLKSSNVFSIVATIEAYKKGGYWVDGLIEYLKGNVNIVLERFRKTCVKVVEPEGTYLMWLDFRECDIPYKDLPKILVENGVWLQDGRKFGEAGEGFMRMNIATPRSILEEAISRILKVVNRLPT